MLTAPQHLALLAVARHFGFVCTPQNGPEFPYSKIWLLTLSVMTVEKMIQIFARTDSLFCQWVTSTYAAIIHGCEEGIYEGMVSPFCWRHWETFFSQVVKSINMHVGQATCCHLYCANSFHVWPLRSTWGDHLFENRQDTELDIEVPEGANKAKTPRHCK